MFLLSFEHTKTKSSYPDIFSGINAIPTCLLYAKKMRNDNQANDALLSFIKAPLSVDQSTIEYLKEYANTKYNKL